MKKINFAVVFAVLACLMAFSAFAETNISFDLSEVSAEKGVYKIVATVNQDGTGNQFNSFQAILDFDYSIFKPVNKSTYSLIDISKTTSSKAPIQVTKFYDENEGDYVDSTVARIVWAVNAETNIANLIVEHGPLVGQDPIDDLKPNNLMLMEMYFVFADGKSASDITENSFVINTLTYTDKFGLPDVSYNIGSDTNTIVLNNNVIHKTQTIPVPASSHVYFQDGSHEFFATDTAVEVPKVAGYIVVNTGYDSQVQYKVAADGSFERVKLLDNALLGSATTGLRTTDPTGIRFYSSISDAAKIATLEANGYEIYEYGYIVTVENTKTGLTDGGYTLDLALVEAGKAKKGVSYDKAAGTDIKFDLDSEAQRTIFTGVLKNVPETKAALTTYISARTYYKAKDADGIDYVVYGQITRNTIYNVAKAIKDENGPDYMNNQEYIDRIISAVGEDTGVDAPSIDISKLFGE